MNFSFAFFVWLGVMAVATVAVRRSVIPVTILWLCALGALLCLFGSHLSGWIWVPWVVALIITKFAQWTWAVVSITVVALLALAIGFASAAFEPAAAATTTTVLTVNAGDLLPKEAICTNDEFNNNSIVGVKPGNKGFRQWSDSVSIPFKSSDKAGMLTEVFAENCGNPTFLGMNIKALSRVSVDGITVASVNPWMAEFTKSTGGLRAAWLTKKTGQGDKIFVTGDMQHYAALANTLISRFNNNGIVTAKSVTNWHLPVGGLVAGELPLAVINGSQEALPVLRLEITEKARGCIVAIGFNTADKRYETLPCVSKSPSKAKPPTTTTKTTTTTPSVPKTTTPNVPSIHKDVPTPPVPARVCPPSQPHGTWPVCKDDPSRDPQNQGNNKPGGGGLAPVQTDPQGPPAAGKPPVKYTAPPVPAPVATIPTGSHPDPSASTPPLQTAAPVPSAPASGCSPAPGRKC